MKNIIDEKTSVPLIWVLAGFASGLTPIVMGAMWVQAVNFRLTRIEEKLGIPSYPEESGEKEGDNHHARARPLPESLVKR